MSETDNFSHRAGYHADPLAVAIKQARKGGTLAAGEGALLVAEIDRLHAAVERVRALHTPIIKGDVCQSSCDSYMVEIAPKSWCWGPCSTLRALDGDA